MTSPSADRRRARPDQRHVIELGGRDIPTGPLYGLATFVVLAAAIQFGSTLIDPVIHQALAPQRVAVDPVKAEQIFPLMHKLGVESYGTIHFCDYVVDARGTFVSDLNADGCDRFQADDNTALVLDAQAMQERAQLRADEQALGLPPMRGIALGYDENGLLTSAGFGVDSCVEYNFEPAAPMDLDAPSPSARGGDPWQITDVCALSGD